MFIFKICIYEFVEKNKKLQMTIHTCNDQIFRMMLFDSYNTTANLRGLNEDTGIYIILFQKWN